MEMILRILNSLLGRFGLSLTLNRNRSDLPSLIRRLRQAGIELNTIYDVGAYKGLWTKALARRLSKGANFYLFEPNQTFRKELEKIGYPVYSVLLSDKSGFRKFYGNSGPGDSYYPEEASNSDTLSERDVPCTTLDELFLDGNNELLKPDLLKIDTQGSELDILSGAQHVIRDLKVLIVECPIVKYNVGAPSLQEYIDKIIQWGFVPFQVVEIHILREVFVQIDIAFLSKSVFEAHYGRLDERGYWLSTMRHYGV